MKWRSKYYLVYYIPHDSLFEFLVPICQIISERVTKSINSFWSIVEGSRSLRRRLPGTGLFVTVWSIQINMHKSVRWGKSGLHIYTPRSPHSNSKILGLTTAWFGGAEEMFIHNWVSEIHLEINTAYWGRKRRSDSRWISKYIRESLGPEEKKLALVQSSYEINTDCLSMYLFT